MPDASMDACLSALVAAGFGAEGQISMTLTTIIFVGDSLPWEKELVEHAKALKVNVGTDPNADIGPVYTKEVKDRICRLVQSGIECGARLLLDGRNVMVPGYENGNFLGPTILSGVTTNMECYKEEIFGPVLLCMQAESLEEAISIVNRNNGRRGASIFTTSGITARKFQNEVEAGVVGINVSVPSPCSSFDGSKAFFTGDLNFSGRACLEFYTQVKTIAEQWKYSASLGVLLDVPSSSKPNMRSLGVSSAFQSTSDRNSQNQNTSSTMLSESEREASSGALLSIRPVSETDFTHSGASSVSPTANRDLSGWASHLVLPLSPQWTKTTPPSSERIDVLASKTNNVIKSHASQTTDAAMALAAKDVYVPSSDDNPGPVIHRNNRLAPSRRINDVHPTSERLYMPSTSHLNENMGVAPRTTDISLFSSSERLYMPSTSHLSSQRTGDRIYIPGSSQQADSMTRTSQKNDNVAPATRRVYNATSTSEGFYISSIIQRNTGLPPTSEWLCIPTPATSQRMYSQGSIVSMDEFPSQGNP